MKHCPVEINNLSGLWSAEENRLYRVKHVTDRLLAQPDYVHLIRGFLAPGPMLNKIATDGIP